MNVGGYNTLRWVVQIMFLHEMDVSDPHLAPGFLMNHQNHNMSNNANYFNHSMEPMSANAQLFTEIVKWMELAFIPAIISIGVIGNVVSFVVFTCTYLKQMSSSVYLAGLAASDTVFLLVLLMAWMYHLKIYIYHSPYWCQLFVYLAYISSFLSVWYVVSFTVERYISVAYPLKRRSMCTTKRAKIVICSLAGLALILYTFALWTSDVINYEDGKPYCIVMPQYHDLVITINNIDTLITLIIPTILILGSNFRITIELTQFYRSQELMAEEEWQTAVQSGNLIQDGDAIPQGLNINSSYYRLQMKVTKMLLMVSTVFLLCNIPCHSVRVYAFIMTSVDENYKPSVYFVLTQKVLRIVYYMNFSVHFLLYNLSGKAFRRALVRLWKRIRRKGAQSIQRKRSNNVPLMDTQTKNAREHYRPENCDVFD